MYHDISREGGAGGGAGGPTNILARQSSNSDVIDFVTSSLLHFAHPMFFSAATPLFPITKFKMELVTFQFRMLHI